MVRSAAEGDIQTVAEIYAYYVQNSTATFEIEPPDRREMANRRAAILERGLPYLVAEQDGQVVGYAYASVYRPRPAYRFTVEDSVYVAPESLGRGIGKALLGALIDECRRAGARQMMAVIGGSDNTASVQLHERFSFRHAGTLYGVGFKFDRWLDTTLMQRVL
jgi:phosphinothricin acetyltransferase